MRGQVSDCICCTQGSFAACGRRVSFPAMGKKPKDRRGTAQDGHCVSIFAYPTPSVASRHLPLTGGVGPRTPVTGLPLEVGRTFPARKTGVLGCGFVRATGPWAGGKLGLMRFRFCAWVCRTNAPRPLSAVGAAFGRPRAGLGPAPTERTERSPPFVGAAHWAARGTGVKASGPAQRQTPFRGLRRGGSKTRPPSH